MNVERLHSLLSDAIQDIEDSDMPRLCEDLRNHTRQLAQNPQHEHYQREFATRRSALSKALRSMSYNSFSSGMVEDLKQLGIAQYMGNDMAEHITSIFEKNTLTLTVAADEIEQVLSDFKKLFESLKATAETFELLNIPTEGPNPGEVEVSVVLPRALFEDDLKSLGKEFRDLERIFADITELGTGQRPPTKVRSIASSNFSLYLDYAPQAAAFLALAVERVIKLYKNLLDIRRLRSEMADQGVDNKKLEGVDSHIEDHMKNGINEIVDEVFTSEKVESSARIEIAVTDESRRNELKNSLKITLKGIAARIDRGYRFDVRVGPSTQDDAEGDGESDEHLKNSDAVQIIEDHREGLQFLKLEGEPILELPTAQTEDKDDPSKISEANSEEPEDR